MNIQADCYDLVIGLGEIGKPLLDILSQSYQIYGRDIETINRDWDVNVLHICYPYEIENFVGTTVDYIKEYRPSITIIHSTIVPGTARKISDQVNSAVSYSPVRGKHTKMRQDLLSYSKYVAGITPAAAEFSMDHLARAGFKVKQFSSCEALEMAKLIETTYFGLLISWSQEVERFCEQVNADYNEVMMLTQDISYLPPVVFQPGYIGGHCVIPNTYLLDKVRRSAFIDLIRDSNEQKKEQWIKEGRDLKERIGPRSIDGRGGSSFER